MKKGYWVLGILALVVAWLLTGGCSSGPLPLNLPLPSIAVPGDQSYRGPVYSYPDWNGDEFLPKESEGSTVKRIVVVSTNDFHGNLEGNSEKFLVGSEEMKFQVGGAEVISSYVNILRKRYPQQVLLLDAGDMYSGTLISDSFKGDSVVQYYNYLQYDAVTLGNHEFDYGPVALERRVPNAKEDAQGAIKKIVASSKVPFVISNVLDLATGRLVTWPGSVSSLVKRVNGVDVGIVGITTTDTPGKVIKDNVRGLYFEKMVAAILKGAHDVRNNGAQVVLLLIHEGNDCALGSDGAGRPITKVGVNKSLENADKALCDQSGALAELLKKLPAKSVDAVVSGHSHTLISHYFSKIPVIQAGSKGGYLARMELFYDSKEKRLLEDRTVLYAPVKTCKNFFATSLDCFRPDMKAVEKLEKKGGKESLLAAKFLGEEIIADGKVWGTLLKSYKDKVDKQGQEVVVTLKRDLKHDRDGSSELGTLLADAIRFVTKTPVAVTNPGGVRSSLSKGPITFADIYKSVPFENNVMKVRMTGRELEKLVKIGTSVQGYGLGNFSGLKIWVNKNRSHSEDLNGNGSIEEFEKSYFVKMTFSDGTPVILEKEYEVGTQTFLGQSGGDNYGIVFSPIAEENKLVDYNMTYRQALIKYLEHLDSIKVDYHSAEKSYLDYSPSKYIWNE
ncbi:MAG: 5'-nucleotidase C-terminal domain-containing protein [Oligoflexia bacterium]|nr:5'-nucleotidase C-terminal domain-containing protein [Oligoflexia bacterium]